MLAELERDLVAWLGESALAGQLRQIASLPDLDGESLAGRFATDAPALYVCTGGGEAIGRGLATVTLGVACVARNSRGHQAARQGDGVVVGLVELIEAVVILLDGAQVGEQAYQVVGWQQVSDPALARKAVFAALVTLHTVVDLPTCYAASGLEALLC